MASLVYFKKLSERPGSFRYSFGDDPAEMSRTLTLATGSRIAVPDDGDIDYTYLKAYRMINALFDERNAWPERGMSAS